MARPLLSLLMLMAFAGDSRGQAPDAFAIQIAMNQGLELEFPHFQELTDVVVQQGGVTADNDFLFICTGRLSWKLSTADLTAVLQQEIVKEVERQGGSEELWLALNASLTTRLKRIATFQAGDTATLVRFRVRIEQAGADWIVTESRAKQSVRNPLSILEL